MFDRIVGFSLRNRAAVLFFTLVVASWGWRLASAASPSRRSPIRPTRRSTSSPSSRASRPRRSSARSGCRSSARSTARRAWRGCATCRCSACRSSRSPSTTASTRCSRAPQVLERLRDAELPEGVTPELGPLATPIGEIYRYTLSGAGGDPMQLRTLQDWVVRPRAAARRRRRRRRQLRRPGARDPRAARSPAALAAFGLTLADLEQALRAGVASTPAAACSSAAPSSSSSAARACSSRLDDIAHRCASPRRDGTPVLRARRRRRSPRAGRRARASSAAGSNYDTVEGIVLMRRGENPSRRARARCARRSSELNGRLAADGRRRSTPFYDRTELVDTTLQTVGHNLLEGARPGHARALRLPARPARRAHRRGADPALAALGVHLPAGCAA